MNPLSDSPPPNAGVIAPPPLLFLGVLAIGLALDYFVLDWRLGAPDAARFAFAAAAVSVGAALIIIALGVFKRAGTPAPPWLPSTALVTTGIYAVTRNPMYLGMALFYAGIAVWADSAPALALLIPVLLTIRFGVIAREERYMEKLFGEDYRAYKKRVRRWI